jgi:DNA-directed RNA polymerase specialized sigma24 family protein
MTRSSSERAISADERAAPSGQAAFETAATRLLESLRSDNTVRAGQTDVDVVTTWLTRWLSGRFRLSRDDAEEIASAAIEAVFEASVEPSNAGTPIRNPVGYLVWTARNRAIDRLRRRSLGEAQERAAAYGNDVADDDLAALLEREASAADIRQAMRAAADAGDHLAVRIVGAWLNLASEAAKEPTSRDVAARAEVSHTSVNQALRRFRGYFPVGGPGSS